MSDLKTGQVTCDGCGRFVSLYNETTYRRLLFPDSAFTHEEFETFCEFCTMKIPEIK